MPPTAMRASSYIGNRARSTYHPIRAAILRSVPSTKVERKMVATARPKLHFGHKMEMGRSARRTEYHPATDPAGAHGAETEEASLRGAMEGLWVEPAMGRDMAGEITVHNPEGHSGTAATAASEPIRGEEPWSTRPQMPSPRVRRGGKSDALVPVQENTRRLLEASE